MPKNKELSPREHDVAKLICEGNSNKLIAMSLGISEHTVKYHVDNFVQKMDAHTRVDAAVKYALARAEAARVLA